MKKDGLSIDEILRLSNFWDKQPRAGFKREDYLLDLIRHLNSRVIKVLIGQRRSGKSYVMRQLISYLLEEKKVPPKNILYLDFENQFLYSITKAPQLHKLIQRYLSHHYTGGKFYLFLDEIQEVAGWEKILTAYLGDSAYDLDIFITGSNSKLLSSELATYLTGRYIEKEIFPFSFTEYCDSRQLPCDRPHMMNYLQDSGIPELLNFQDKELKASYLSALKDSIVMKDVVRRFSVKNPQVLESIFHFLSDNIGNLFSITSIVNKLRNIGVNTNAMTLMHYIACLEAAYLAFGISRYDLKGKKILEGEKKYYLTDLGFRNYFISSFDPGLNKNLENYVFLMLKLNGFSVYVGRIQDAEIDFVAEKQSEKLYVQVAFTLIDTKTLAREYGSLENVRDNWKKIVVSLDEVQLPSRNGISHIRAWEFEAYLKTLFNRG